MKISFVLPAYNEEKVIQETLGQFEVLREAGIDHEVIVSDNGSTDPTSQLVRDAGATAVELNGREKGTIGHCRNRGAEVATGDILWFIDADVLIQPLLPAVKQVLHRFESSVKLVAGTLPIRIYTEEETFSDRFWYGFVNSLTWFQNVVIRTGGAPGDCQIVRRTAFEAVDGFDTTLHTSEDHDLFMRLSKKGRLAMFRKGYARMSGRRIHADGWAKILYTWGRKWAYQFILHKKDATEWEARR